jgi:hypothetical protein
VPTDAGPFRTVAHHPVTTDHHVSPPTQNSEEANYISFFCRCDMVPAYRGEIGMSLAARFLHHARLHRQAAGERMGGFLWCSQGYDRSSITDARQTKGGTGGLNFFPVARRLTHHCRIAHR